MAERIGLEAVLEDADFQRGLRAYLSGIGLMEDKTDNTASKLNTSLSTVGSSFMRVGQIVATGFVTAIGIASAAVTAFTVNGIKGAADLEAQISGIAAVMGETAEAVEPLKDLILDLGLDPRLKVDATEAANAVELLARNGLEMSQIMEGAAFSTVLLANATGSDFGQAADIGTDAMSIFNIEAKDMQEAVNGIVSVTNASKFGINDYALALANGGAKAKSAGVSFEEFNTALVAIAPSFSSGQTAGTGLANLLLRLVPATEKAAEEMQDLGLISFDANKAMQLLRSAGVEPAGNSIGEMLPQLSQLAVDLGEVEEGSDDAAAQFQSWASQTGLLSNQFFDAQGNLKSLDQVAQILQDSIGGLSEEQRIMTANTIFGRDAMTALTAVMELGAESGEGAANAFNRLNSEMAETDAVESAETRMQNLQGTMEILQGQIETTGIQVGQQFLPVLSDLATRMTSLAEDVGPRVVAFFGEVAGGFSTFIDEIDAGATPIEALKTALEQLGLSNQVVDTLVSIAGAIKTVTEAGIGLSTWAIQNGDTIIATVKGIGAAFLIFKTGMGIMNTVTALQSLKIAAVAAGGGMQGLVALAGGPAVVALGALAVAVGGVVIASQKLNDIYKEQEPLVEEAIQRNKEIADATGDYRTEGEKLTNALADVNTFFGRFTGLADDVESAIIDLAVRSGDYTGTNADLEKSLQEVFGAGLKVERGVVKLNGEVITHIGTLKQQRTELVKTEMAQKNQAAALERSTQQAQQFQQQMEEVTRAQIAQANADRDSAHATQELASQQDELSDKMRQREIVQQNTILLDQQQAATERQLTQQTEESIRVQQRMAEVRQQSMQEIPTLVSGVSLALDSLRIAQEELALSPWDQALITKAQEAEVQLSAAFGAIKESNRQMVLEMFVNMQNLAGGFDESAANIAVALGIMTQQEADLRLETQETQRQVGLLGERLLQTFMEDGSVSAAEAKILEQAINGVEDGAFTAGHVINALATGSLEALISGEQSAQTETQNLKTELLDLEGTATTAAGNVESAFTSPNWHGIGFDISSGIANGITSGASQVNAAASGVAKGGVQAAKDGVKAASPSKLSEDEVGIPISQGIAVGIERGASDIDQAAVSVSTGAISTFQGEFEGMKDLGADAALNLARGFASVGSSAAGAMRRDVIQPIRDEVKGLQSRLGEQGQILSRVLGVDDSEDVLNPARLTQEYFNAIATGNEGVANLINNIWDVQNQITRTKEEQVAAEEKILRLQEAQQRLQFLQQQQRLLQIIEENELNAEQVLQGLELGIDADSSAVVEAMTRAINAVIQQAEGQLGIASPSKVFKRIGEFSMQGLASGIMDGFRGVTSTLDNGLVGMIGSATTSMVPDPATMGGSVFNSSSVSSTTTNQFNLSTTTRQTDLDVRQQFSLMRRLGAV